MTTATHTSTHVVEPFALVLGLPTGNADEAIVRLEPDAAAPEGDATEPVFRFVTLVVEGTGLGIVRALNAAVVAGDVELGAGVLP